MSFAIEVLRDEWRSAFWALMNYGDPVPMPEWDLEYSRKNNNAAREYMRAHAAEIVRLKKLEAKATELEAENAWLKAQLADCTQFDSPTWVNPAFEEFRARNWARINDPRK